MPCRSYGDDEDILYAKRERIHSLDLEKKERKIAFLESALCAVFRASKEHFDSDLLDLIDYKEAGITKSSLSSWKKKHDEKDRKRIEHEAVVANALSKLTEEERKALKIK